LEDEIRITGDVAARLREAAQQYGFDPERFVDYLLNVLLAAGPGPVAAPKKEDQAEFREVLERLKSLGYT
jgi:Ser/Thr protein kinase RdoA (MazF antagonist)